nr:MAG TPA: hypothetical protein [Caudoviricetes sp.]
MENTDKRCIYDIYFRAHSVQHHIKLKNPIEGMSYLEIKEKAKIVVEQYMLKNSIPGPYQLCFM